MLRVGVEWCGVGAGYLYAGSDIDSEWHKWLSLCL